MPTRWTWPWPDAHKTGYDPRNDAGRIRLDPGSPSAASDIAEQPDRRVGRRVSRNTRRVSTPSSEVIEDFIAGMRVLSSGVPGGYQERGDGVVLNVIGLASPSTNTVHILEPTASRIDARRFVGQLREAGLPFVLRVRPNPPDWVVSLAAESGLVQQLEFPIMQLVPTAPWEIREPPLIVEVDPDDTELVRRVTDAFTTGNEVPPGVFDPLVAPPMFDRPEAAVYAALHHGVVTSVGIRLQVPDAVGVFGVATPPEHRRRGLGEAITARIVMDGLAAGARSAFLGATPMGYRIYERLGFRTVETWTFHVPGQPSSE